MLLNDNFIIGLGILVCIIILCAVGLWLKVYGIQSFKKNVRESIFYLKWFLIGKYHCNVSGKTKIFLKGFHKLFWGFIIIAIALLFADIVQFIGG